MKITETLRKPMMEAKYLNVDNTDRYRPIIRLFYLNYEKLKYWMYQEEVYEELREDPAFASYTPEQCQQDLTALTAWGNLVTIQDTRRVSTIEEFKNKKFRYQLSETTVEIERMVIRVENLHIESSSLEPSLLERLRISLARINELESKSDEKVYAWWKDLNTDFIRLNQNYQDYMRELNSVKAEEMMKTREFLIFKERLTEYLRNFVKSLQTNVAAIEECLKETAPEFMDRILERIVKYELSIPRLEEEADEELIRATVRGRWTSVREWFCSTDGKDSEAVKVFDTTNEIIRRITRYAARISEQSGSGANRREEYYKIAVMFSECSDIWAAHRLAASVFGIEKPLHFKEIGSRNTESINSGVFDEEPAVIPLMPRVRTYKERAQRSEIEDRSREKAERRRAEIQRLEEERILLSQYIKSGKLEFARLPEIEPHVRDVFLTWLSKALENKSMRGKTEDGVPYRVEPPKNKEMCAVRAEDGVFYMPAYAIIFEEAL